MTIKAWTKHLVAHMKSEDRIILFNLPKLVKTEIRKVKNV